MLRSMYEDLDIKCLKYTKDVPDDWYKVPLITDSLYRTTIHRKCKSYGMLAGVPLRGYSITRLAALFGLTMMHDLSNLYYAGILPNPIRIETRGYGKQEHIYSNTQIMNIYRFLKLFNYRGSYYVSKTEHYDVIKLCRDKDIALLTRSGLL